MSIGAVFTNEFVLSAPIDLTIFITVFQISFSLGLLITLNMINKRYFCQQRINFDPLLANDKSHDDDIDDDLECASLDDSDHVIHYKHSKSNEKASESLFQLFFINVPSKIDLKICKKVFPLSILYMGMLLLNNYCLEYVGVAFYFVSRSLTTVFNVIFTYFLMNQPVSRGPLACCGLIIIGFILGIDQESIMGSLSVLGVIFGVLSSLFTSLFTIFTKKTLDKVNGNIWIVIMYNNINALTICTPLLLFHGDIYRLITNEVIDPWFWLIISASGVMSFLISIVTNASIKFTSPLTHNISGTAKSCFQTCLAVLYNHEDKSLLWWVSNFVILAASASYSRLRQLEMRLGSMRHVNKKGDFERVVTNMSGSNSILDDMPSLKSEPKK